MTEIVNQTDTHWAQQFFGRLYGELYSRHLLTEARSRAEARFAVQVADLRGARVLDLAAGFCRHARHVAKHAAQVVALDLNRQYLAMPAPVRRNAKAETSKSKPTPEPHRVQGDMRTLPFAPECFDAVLLLFNSFGYFGTPPARAFERDSALSPHSTVWRPPDVFFERGLLPAEFGQFADYAQWRGPRRSPKEEADAAAARMGASGSAAGGDDRAADLEIGVPGKSNFAHDPNAELLRRVASLLAPGGRLLIELPAPRNLRAAIAQHPRSHYSVGDFEVQEEHWFDSRGEWLLNRTQFRRGDVEEMAEYALRVYEPRELRDMLLAAGLRTVERFGDYDGSPFDARRSPHLIVLAAKR